MVHLKAAKYFFCIFQELQLKWHHGFMTVTLSVMGMTKFPAESGYKANHLTQYKVDNTRRVLPYI